MPHPSHPSPPVLTSRGAKPTDPENRADIGRRWVKCLQIVARELRTSGNGVRKPPDDDNDDDDDKGGK
ncbi:hypothetical protein F2P81_024520 [Scophthalmus maximus]|uniref:Uncharacterized protein n=1 Tax=Scophthalmus maximus TaxID=52904 RepID=A0A6A4RX41_SCOMX|nr:hypothetical protein F2P81_024520 [Scophthalmus maximus]